LIHWEKRYAAHLVTLGKIGNVLEVTRELRSILGVELSIEIVRNTLKEANLGSFSKASMLALSTKNVKERLEFA